MSKQILTLEQMLHLQKLGLEVKSTMLSYVHGKLLEDEEWDLTTLKNLPRGMFEQIPAYTLQDMLNVLPNMISVENEYWLEISMEDEEHWSVSYRECDTGKETTLEYIYDEELIDAVYKLLCWAIENGYVETNKSK